MKHVNCAIFFVLILRLNVLAQPCGVVQSLNSAQQSQLSVLQNPIDTALKYEILFKIDSLSAVMKNIYSSQGGRPDGAETSYTVSTNTNWLSLPNSITLSRILIHADSLTYANLWRLAKGMSPPSYQPHSLFLRASAEIAAGLLKIADKETNVTRKTLYQSWATRALDSLATMQIQNGPSTGAFPFPDLRVYGDPTFGPIIQNFMFSCGSDSVNVLQNGFIINDKGTGEFKFDAGVIANAYFEAYNYTGNINYKNIAISIGNYTKGLKFNLNYNYNTFVSLALTRAYQLTNDTSYLNRAIKTIRYSVYPGQIANGRWVDGHNANLRYHSIILQNIVPTNSLIPNTNGFKNAIDTMTYKAVKNIVDYSYNCYTAIGYRWLLKAYALNNSMITQTLKDSISDLIGRQINQSASHGDYLDVPTMGEYLELLGTTTSVNDFYKQNNFLINAFPNPIAEELTIEATSANDTKLTYILLDALGRMVLAGNLNNSKTTINTSNLEKGFYSLSVTNEKGSSLKTIKLVK
ncbi:MAG: T9SS type A sorting domain-containing protein [Bacteroidetes bacterium]|nr:T9SS type A sorting domain-containing protein [Bacteroidota bacterium]